MNNSAPTQYMDSNKQTLLRLKPQTTKTFGNFFPAGNEIIVERLRRLSIPDPKTKSSIKQTYLWGGRATGKSHLMQASCQNANQSGMRSVYLPFSEVATHGTSILSGLKDMDILCLDDIDTVLFESDWQKSLFNLINDVHARNGCLIIAGQSNPIHLNIAFKDLHSRLVWGLVHGMQPLSDQNKHAALCTLIKNEDSTVTEESVSYLLHNYSRDLGQLAAAIKYLDNKAKQTKKNRVTIHFIKENLKTMPI